MRKFSFVFWILCGMLSVSSSRSMVTPVLKGNFIQRIGRVLPKENRPTIGIAILTAFTVIGLITFAFGAGVWRKRASIPKKRWSLSTVAVNDKIYAIGGFAVNEISTVEEYAPTTDTWTRKTNMPTPRGALSTAVMNGKIYAIGGWDADALSTVEEYDSATDTWTRKASMPTARHALSTTVVNGQIYAIGGGGTGNRLLATVEMYEPATDTWTKKASMPTTRGLHSASMVNGKIYAIGGWAGKLGAIGKALSTVEEYDPAQDTWTKGAKMPTSRWALSTSVVNDKIYAIGGTTITKGKWATVSNVEVYHPATGKWTQESRMSSPRGWLSTSAVKGNIYAIGGTPKYMIGVGNPVLLSTVEEFERYRYGHERPALWISGTEQMFLFGQAPEVDELQMMVNDNINGEMAKGRRPSFTKDYPDVIVKGNIPAFAAHHPVFVLKEFGDAKKGLTKKEAKKRKRGLRRWIPFF